MWRIQVLVPRPGREDKKHSPLVKIQVSVEGRKVRRCPSMRPLVCLHNVQGNSEVRLPRWMLYIQFGSQGGLSVSLSSSAKCMIEPTPWLLKQEDAQRVIFTVRRLCAKQPVLLHCFWTVSKFLGLVSCLLLTVVLAIGLLPSSADPRCLKWRILCQLRTLSLVCRARQPRC